MATRAIYDADTKTVHLDQSKAQQTVDTLKGAIEDITPRSFRPRPPYPSLDSRISRSQRPSHPHRPARKRHRDPLSYQDASRPQRRGRARRLCPYVHLESFSQSCAPDDGRQELFSSGKHDRRAPPLLQGERYLPHGYVRLDFLRLYSPSYPFLGRPRPHQHTIFKPTDGGIGDSFVLTVMRGELAVGTRISMSFKVDAVRAGQSIEGWLEKVGLLARCSSSSLTEQSQTQVQAKVNSDPPCSALAVLEYAKKTSPAPSLKGQRIIEEGGKSLLPRPPERHIRKLIPFTAQNRATQRLYVHPFPRFFKENRLTHSVVAASRPRLQHQQCPVRGQPAARDRRRSSSRRR